MQTKQLINVKIPNFSKESTAYRTRTRKTNDKIISFVFQKKSRSVVWWIVESFRFYDEDDNENKIFQEPITYLLLNTN